MEADWEVEIGSGAPVIDAAWSGFIDLRQSPHLARELPEVAIFPALTSALQRLNMPTSPIWTAKCDVWQLPDPATLDPFEMDADAVDLYFAWACYIDLLPPSDQQWMVPDMAIRACRFFCNQLRAVPQRLCRSDLIVRQAIISSTENAYGITAYLTACGATDSAARDTLQGSLQRFVDALVPVER